MKNLMIITSSILFVLLIIITCIIIDNKYPILSGGVWFSIGWASALTLVGYSYFIEILIDRMDERTKYKKDLKKVNELYDNKTYVSKELVLLWHRINRYERKHNIKKTK